MLTINQYAGVHRNSPDWTAERQQNAEKLIKRVNNLIIEMAQCGVSMQINPMTDSWVGGETMGGFRPQSCPIGAPQSAHKTGQAIDLFDPQNTLDDFITKNSDLLVKYDLYREHPDSTLHWLHLSTRKPASGRRTFRP